MFFNNFTMPKLIILISFLFLIACANKQALVEVDPALEAARIQAEKETQEFKRALGLIQTENAQEKDLLQAKDILDALYESNSAYLGALINSADISLKLEKLDEAKSLYLSVLQRIDDQKNAALQETSKHKKGSLAKGEDSSEQTKPMLSEHINTFTLHTYNQLGLIARQQGQFDEAEDYYRQALALDSENPITLNNLAILLDLYKGRLAEALVLYEQYQSIINGPDSKMTDPKIKDWIYDLKNRLPVEASIDKEEVVNE